MKTPEEFLRNKYSHIEDYENSVFGFYEVISIIEEYQQVKNLNIPAVIKTVCGHKNKTKIGFGISDEICNSCRERISNLFI